MEITGRSLRVVIAGGRQDFQAVARRWLDRHPCVLSVDAVGSGREALTAAGRGEVDLVLIDAVLPDMDGFEATRRIKQGPQPPLVVILVLFEYAALREEARRAGADACVDKSVLTQELEPMLERFAAQIGTRRSSDEPASPA